ncbi:MAG: TonB-dependent receptor [Bacteroidaceae bacterium]|nr:TonB-dependent receptor [Bacteroidaceae bacterium]
MRKKHQLLVLALFAAPFCFAQTKTDTISVSNLEDEIHEEGSSFVLSESQLGEDDDQTVNIIQVGSANNVYTNNIGYQWSPVRFKFRSYDSRYNDMYMNGVMVNNIENGRFNFSTIGGMNDATRNQDISSPFEDNSFSVPNLGGSGNYNFRASMMPAGHKVTLSGANRNYTIRAMYTFGTGLTDKGWAFFGTIGYRWANMQTAAVKGTFYNSLGYFLSLQKVINDKHSFNIATWGNPTERAQQGASTDEAYWLANDRQYNPYWGYQNGKMRSSRVVNNFEPTLLLTWDYKINDKMKLTTSLVGKYVKYSATRLQYNDSQNPAPDYWKNFPSSQYDVWDVADVDGNGGNIQNWEYGVGAWQDSYDYWTRSEANRQINFDRLYAANHTNNALGKDAAYFISAKHNDHLNLRLGSTFDYTITQNIKWRTGIQLGTNKGMHYQTIEDMLGAKYMTNVNNYAIGAYMPGANETYYNLYDKLFTSPHQIGEGDRYGYDYNIFVRDAKAWTSFTFDKGITHYFISAKIGGTQMWRDGKMNNGICPNFVDENGREVKFSYGESKKAGFLDGGTKMGATFNLGKGHGIALGLGFETRAPFASTAFVSPEMNNNFVKNLRNEKITSAEVGYRLNNNWLQLNVTGYYTHTYHGTEWQNFYFDDVNSFTYVSLTDVSRDYYGVEWGAKFKITSSLDITAMGTWSDNKYNDDSKCVYTLSTYGTENQDICRNKGMRESGTPLSAYSLAINYRIKRWYLSLIGNYYDRIYLSYSPCLRYHETLKTFNPVDASGTPYVTEDLVTGAQTINDKAVPAQARGNGGFMLDASIGRQFFVAHHPLSINLTLTNILNNRKICTGGYEQSRSNYSTNKNGTQGNERIYDFSKNPKKFYAQGFNFMLNINYRF